MRLPFGLHHCCLLLPSLVCQLHLLLELLNTGSRLGVAVLQLLDGLLVFDRHLRECSTTPASDGGQYGRTLGRPTRAQMPRAAAGLLQTCAPHLFLPANP